MAAISWPASLDCPLYQGFSQREQSAVIRSPMGYGPAKVRNRTTAAIEVVTMSMHLDSSDVGTLEGFYKNASARGTIPFDYKNHLTEQNPVEYRFTSPPVYRPVAANLWRAELNLEILP